MKQIRCMRTGHYVLIPLRATEKRDGDCNEREAFRSESGRLTTLSHKHSGSQVPGITTILNFRVVKDCKEHLPFSTLI